MDSTPPGGEGRPGAMLIPLSIPCMAVSLLAWGAITVLELIGGYSPDPSILLYASLLPLPAAFVGAVAAWRSGRWWPWYVGLVLTLLPALLALVLAEPFDPGLGTRDWD